MSPNLSPHADLTEAVIERLRAVRSLPPKGLKLEQWQASIDYAIGRYTRRTMRQYELILARAGLGGHTRALDLGCGAGHFTIPLARAYAHVDAVDSSVSYAEITRLVAAEAAIGERVTVTHARAEECEFLPERFDAVFTNSVLFFTDHESVLSNVSRWLVPGGRLYCAYTTTGGRLRNMQKHVEARRPEQVLAQAHILLAQFLFEAGICTTSPRIRVFSPQELAQLLEALGYVIVDAPGVQEYRGAIAGYPYSFDMVAEKRESLEDIAGRLTREASDASRWAQALRGLVLIGAPSLVVDVLERSGEDIAGSRELADLYVRALLKSGRIRGQPLRDELTGSDGPLANESLHGLYLLEHRRVAPALDALQRGPESPEQQFLVAVCLHQLKRYVEARAVFERELERDPTDIRALSGVLASLAAEGDLDTTGIRLTRFLDDRERLADAG